MLASAQLAHRKMLLPVGEGDVRVVGNPIKYAETAQAPLEMAPTLGADSVAILSEIAGYAEEHIARVIASGVVRSEPWWFPTRVLTNCGTAVQARVHPSRLVWGPTSAPPADAYGPST